MRLLIIGLLFSAAAVAAEPRTLYYASHPSGQDPFLPYFLELLAAVAEDQDWQYEWQPHPLYMNQVRTQQTMTQGSDALHLAWMMTNHERERSMLAVPVPLFMGLIGWRIPLLPHAHLSAESQWQESDWKRLQAGQLADWPDTDILRANGLPVMTASAYSSLFLMLEAGRFDYFPRSIIEIEQELSAHQALNIAMSQHWLLHYPAPLYFFVNPKEPELARQLHQGLLNLHANGRFRAIFLSHYGERINRLNLSGRKVLRLHNPLLPASVPLDQSMLWWPLPSHQPAETE